MAVSYKPLWHQLVSKGMNKGDLREALGISSTTLAKLGKDEYVSMEVIDKICQYFGCRVEDVIEITLNEECLEVAQAE